MESNISASVIARIEQISPSWLTTVLAEQYLAENDRVASCRATQIAVGEGFAGRLYRLFLTFDRASPSTLIAKLATDDEPIPPSPNSTRNGASEN